MTEKYPNYFRSDEYFWAPAKKNIVSLNTEKGPCLSPFGPVSDMNCPNNNPTCNCSNAVQNYQPEGLPVTDEELASAKTNTNECNDIKQQLGNEWLGIDPGNPYSSYNCNYCEEFNTNLLGISYQDTPGITSSWKNYFLIKQIPFFNYDKRKTYDGLEFPPSVSIIPDLGSDCQDIQGRYFKYYKEYSKTAATFWNTPPRTPLNRRAQVALLGAQRIKILVNGDLRARPGKLIYVDYPNFGGRWMIYKVQRVVKPQKHSMFLYLMRDGVA